MSSVLHFNVCRPLHASKLKLFNSRDRNSLLNLLREFFINMKSPAKHIYRLLTDHKVGSTVHDTKGAFVWDQSGIRIIGIMRVSVCLGAILIPEYLDFHSGYSAPRSRIAGIYSGIYSYSGISQTNAP